MKIKYTWQTVHGDADHYDNQELILTDEDEIALFDYITTEIKFEHRMAEGFLPTEEQIPTLLSLIRKIELKYSDWVTPSFEEFKNLIDEFDDIRKKYKEAILSDLLEIITDWNYEVWDVTCGYMHYAKIQNFRREDITNTVSTNELLNFIIDKYKFNKTDLEKEYLTKKDINKKQGFTKLSIEIPLDVDKPNKNGLIFSRQSYETLSEKDLQNIPIIIYDKDFNQCIGTSSIPVGVGNGKIIDDSLFINGYLWGKLCGLEYSVEDFNPETNTVNKMQITAFSLNQYNN